MNDGFNAQSSDLPFAKASYSASPIPAAGGPWLLNPSDLSPSVAANNVAVAAPPTLGGPGGKLVSAMPIQGLLPQIPNGFPGSSPYGGSIPQLTGSVPPNGLKINGMVAQFLGLTTNTGLVTFTLWVQRLTLLNAAAVSPPGTPSYEAAVPVYGLPLLAPVATPIATAAVSIAASATGAPTQVFTDLSLTPLDVVPGDTYFVVASFSGTLAGSITDAQVSLF